ncbi:MAG TPA: hypothetical protein VMD29_09685 [Terracidiphilus sp.]|nr:hypothetical protein [Terracidiphilus sp.]
MSVFEAWGGLIRDGWGRFRRAWGWVLAEYVGVAALIALGLLWTRVPEKHGWQVALTFALPVVVAAAFLWLQAGLVRGFLQPAVAVEEAEQEYGDEDAKWVPIAWGAATLLVWVAIGWALWLLLDKFDDYIYGWAGYLNSKFDPHSRARWASYASLSRDLQWAEWALRWVIVPGLLIPLGVCSAAWGLLRLHWRRALAVWGSWKWWPVVAAWALLGEWWPQTWFTAEPHGAVRAQIWRVGLKLAAAYLLAITGWVKVLGWGAMLVNPRPRSRMDEPVLTLGLGAPTRPIAADALAGETSSEETVDAAALEDSSERGAGSSKSEDDVVGRPLPRGGEDRGRNT